MSEHTKGPWFFKTVTDGRGCVTVSVIGGERRDSEICSIRVKKCRSKHARTNWAGTADARRIVACVNACDGWATEKLEGVGSVGTKVLFEILLNHRDQLLAQRKRLLSALELYGLPLSGDDKQDRAEFGDCAVDRELRRRAAIAVVKAGDA